MNQLMIFEGHEVEVFEFKGEVLFNPYHVGDCLDMASGTVKDHMSKMSSKQVVKVKNSDVGLTNFRKLNNAGENFLTESGVYKLVFKSRKPNAERFTDWIADEVLPALRKTGSYKMLKEDKKQSKPKKKELSSTNMLVQNVNKIFTKAGVDPVYIAAEAKRLYAEAGYEIQIPLITDTTMPELYDCTSMAKELGVMSTSGKPHGKAISAVIQKIAVDESEIVKTAYSRNGHDGVTVQYKGSIFEKVKEWLESNGYPTIIEYKQSDGCITRCQVVYQEVA